MGSIKTSGHEITLSGTEDAFWTSLSATQLEEGIDLIHIRMVAEEPASPPAFTLFWTHPVVDIHAYWRTAGDHDKSLPPEWIKGFMSKVTSQAPVCSLHSFSGRNRLTFAFSDALRATEIRVGVHEETAMLHCSIKLFLEPSPPLKVYEATLRLDTRDIPYYESLEQVQQWWAAQPGYQPARVPETARLPMYSTWYSFHQGLVASQIEEQCGLAKALGCEAVIVDDGWQTTSNERGYAYTGDWEVASEKIPDMRAHVAKVHQLGMKYILWYSVPFVGKHSKAWSNFAGKTLEVIDRLGAGVLDPRFPEVREYIIATYERALRDWDLDGFKLDFVDSFNFRKQEYVQGQDYLSVPEAVDRLLADIIERLRKIKPDIMVEFRQTYIGPLMRKYGNMFRAGDCPNDALTNRERTLDIRLLCGSTAAHSDMLMWHRDEPVESAALQIVNILFAVPQISLLLNTLPEQHLEMARFWLSFWREHRDVLLDGKLMPLHPEAMYPLVIATTPTKRIAVMYADTVINPGSDLPDDFIIVNGTLGKGVVLEFTENTGTWQLEVRDCRGQVFSTGQVLLDKGLHRIDVPPVGAATLHRR